jgi:hypothetical protein
VTRNALIYGFHFTAPTLGTRSAKRSDRKQGWRNCMESISMLSLIINPTGQFALTSCNGYS